MTMTNASDEHRAQFAALYQRAGWLPLEPWTLIQISGSDRCAFLHNLCTNDIRQCPAGAGREAFLTSVQGKTIGHGMALCADDHLLWMTAQRPSTELLKHLDRYILREDVQLDDVTNAWAATLLCGPDWPTLLGELSQLTTIGSHTMLERPSYRALVVRSSLAVPLNYVLLCAPDDLVMCHADLSRLGGHAFDAAFSETLRIEVGFPRFDVDFTDANLPQELDRNDPAISFTKGCYLGQETVARIDALGHVNWLLRGLVCQSAPRQCESSLHPGMEVSVDDRVVARITSVAYSVMLERTIALGMVRSKFAGYGNLLPAGDGHLEIRPFPLIAL